MTERVSSFNRRKTMRIALIVVVAIVLSGLGVLSLYGQATSVRLDPGFTLLDGSGRLDVQAGGPGAAAGLRAGDRLISFGGADYRGPFDWNRALRGGLVGGAVTTVVERNGARLAVPVTVVARRGGDALYYYLALVGWFFLATATVAALRPVRSELTRLYYALSIAVFCLLALSDTPAGTTRDWILYLADRFGRLGFAPLFCLLAMAIARTRVGGRLRTLTLFAAPPAALAAAGLALFMAAGRGLLRDPLTLWGLKDRGELLLSVVYIVCGLAILARAVRHEPVLHRRYLLRWAFWGSLAGLGPIALLELLPVGLGANPPWWAELSALSLVALPMTLSSALFRLRPGDLELFFKRAITSLSVLFLTLAVFGVVWVLLDRIGRAYLDMTDWVRGGVAALVAAVLYQEIRTLTHQAVDRLVYGGRYSFRRTLLSFGRELNAELDLEALVSRLQDRTRETLDLAAALVLVRHDKEGVLRPVGASITPTVPVASPLMERARGVSYLLLEDLMHAPGAEALGTLRALGIQYLFPMKVKGEVRAVLATGALRGGDSLHTEDVELLVAVCGHAAIALESARLFAELEGKVEEVESLRQFNENILESSRIGILVVEATGVIRAMNRALVDIYGASREQALGRTLAEVFPLPFVRRLTRKEGTPDDGGGIRKLYRQSLTNRQGKKIVVNVSISRLTAPGADAGGNVITLDEVTEQVRLEEQLLRQDRLASIGLLAAGVAHEVNTPLTGISSYAQLLLAELDPSDPRAEILKKIERQTFRAANIVNSLLNFTRDGPGGGELIRVSDLIDESLALFEPQLRGRNIHIESRVAAELPPLPGHRGKLQQVLLNLLLNARDAIGDAGEIRLTAEGRGGRLLLEVSDNGGGIADEDLGKIFDPFFTTKPRGRGTGLGLSLSYTIVQEHKGEISVESRRGEGAIFTVSLPFASRDAVHG